MKKFFIFLILFLPLACAEGFYIDTNKLNYDMGETIFVDIYPKDSWVRIEYAKDSFYAKGKAELIAKEDYNRITASYEDDITNRVINVIDSKTKGFAIELFSICFVGYILYGFVKNYVPHIIS